MDRRIKKMVAVVVFTTIILSLSLGPVINPVV